MDGAGCRVEADFGGPGRPRCHLQHESPRQWLHIALMESFFSTVTSELVDRFGSYAEAMMDVFRLCRSALPPTASPLAARPISPPGFERRPTASPSAGCSVAFAVQRRTYPTADKHL